MMRVEFDPAKDALNRAKHGVSLGKASELKIVRVIEDQRLDYGERRFLAYGLIEGDSHCLVFTLRNGRVRAISLRRARAKEVRRHAKTI